MYLHWRRETEFTVTVIFRHKQECIPVGCILPACNHTGWVSVQGVSLTETLPGQRPPDRDPLDGDPPGQRPHWTETPVQRPPGQTPWSSDLWCMLGQRPPVDRQTPVKTLPCPKLRLRAVLTEVPAGCWYFIKMETFMYRPLENWLQILQELKIRVFPKVEHSGLY